MLHASYEVWGIVIVLLLIGFWIVKRCIFNKRMEGEPGLIPAISNASDKDHDIEHRALMFLMNQKTDSLLAALARTIEQERQKLGVVVRKPSMTDAVDAFKAEAVAVSEDCREPYARILHMVRSGMPESMIARQLDLSEADVSLVMRLNAA